MITHTLKVTGQRIFGAEKISLATDANNTIKFRFDFDKEWRKFSEKAAVFGRVNQEPMVIDFENNSVNVPWEMLTQPEPFFLSVMAYDDKSLLSTQKTVVAVGDSFIPDSVLPSTPTGTAFDRVRAESAAEIESLKEQLEAANAEIAEQDGHIKTLLLKIKQLSGKT